MYIDLFPTSNEVWVTDGIFFNGVFPWVIDLMMVFWCFNATFSNISAISWRPVLVVEEACREPPTMGKQLVNLSLAAVS